MSAIEQSFYEQLRLSDRDLAQRKRLAGFGEADAGLLLALAGAMAPRIHGIVDEFYKIIAAQPEAARIIGDAHSLRRQKESLAKYVAQLFGGDYGQAYAEGRLHMGFVHRRMNVGPKFFFGALAHLHGLLEQAIEEIGEGQEPKAKRARRDALRKLLCFDQGLVADILVHCVAEDHATELVLIERQSAELAEKVARQEKAIEEASGIDPLTGLCNNKGFTDRLTHEMARAERYRLPLTLIYADLNEFNKYAEVHGPDSANDLLISIGRTFGDTIRKADIPCRYGSDEFCVILPSTTIKGARALCDHLIEAYEAKPNGGVTMSMGIVQIGPDTFPTPDELVRLAYEQMCVAKAKARKTPGHQISADS